jgi:hypothetical protein
MVSYEHMLHEINDFGIYQKVRYAMICLAALLPPIVTYMQSFIAPRHPYRCAHPDFSNDSFATRYNFNESQVTSLEKCSIKYDNGSVLACDKWVFDTRYYQKTLTEEVCLIFGTIKPWPYLRKVI